MGSDGEIGAAGLRGGSRLRKQRGAGPGYKRVSIKSLLSSFIPTVPLKKMAFGACDVYSSQSKITCLADCFMPRNSL